MSIRAGIIKVLPKFMLNGLKIRRDRMHLAKAEKPDCDVSDLGQFSVDKLDDIFCREETDELWHRVEPMLSQFSLPNMTGGINPGDRRALFYLLTFFGVTNVLEIGTHIGASTVHVTAAVAENARQQQTQMSLTTVDIADVNDTERRPWIEHGASHSPREMVDKLGYREFVDFQTCKSVDFLDNCKKKFDLIFLDGDHSGLNTYREIPRALNCLNKDGIILLHDYFPELKPLWSDGSLIPGPRLAVKKLVEDGNPIEAIPVGQLPWTTKFNSQLTTLAILSRKDR